MKDLDSEGNKMRELTLPIGSKGGAATVFSNSQAFHAGNGAI